MLMSKPLRRQSLDNGHKFRYKMLEQGEIGRILLSPSNFIDRICRGHFPILSSRQSIKKFVDPCKNAIGVSLRVDCLPRRPSDHAEVKIVVLLNRFDVFDLYLFNLAGL